MATNNKIPYYPPLRFPEFNDEWTQTTLGEIGWSYNGLSGKNAEDFGQGSPYITYKMVYNDVKIDLTNVEYVRISESESQTKVELGDILFTISSESPEETGLCSVLLSPCDKLYLNSFCFGYRLNETNVIKSIFLGYTLRSPIYRSTLSTLAQGSTRYNISKVEVLRMTISLPSLAEQKKIADFLSLIDERIECLSETLKERKREKAGLLNQLFSQKLRFPDFNDEWTQTTLGEILDYEQPTLYIVNNTDYSNDSSLIPVLTANKSFVLGYVNEENIYDKGECIILDDFTLDIKFVDFPFKVKSSAIKILTAKKSVNIKTIYNYLLFMNLRGQEKDHKRHYISEIQPLSIPQPSLEEQKKIADFLSLVDERIEVEEQLLKKYEEQKKYLLRNMFV